MIENQNRILGIDFGLKRIGLALSDPLKIFAYPFITISNDDKLWGNLLQIIKENSVEKIVLGYPLRLNREKTHITNDVLNFKDKIVKRSNLEVILWDETFTSEIAQRNIISSVNKKSKRKDKGIIDRNSASIILQEYLDKMRLS